MKGGEKKKEPEPEGKLRMNQVQSLPLIPDDVDEVIKSLNETENRFPGLPGQSRYKTSLDVLI